MNTTKTVNIYTDGACSGNPGPGGWGWVTEDGRSDSGGVEQTTNQRMELQAVLEALQTIGGPVVVHSDSTYVVKCFTDRWYDGWLARGWRNSQKKPVANRDIWEPLIDLYLERSDEVDFVWVKGHSGNKLNELADELAVAATRAVQEKAAGVPGAIDDGEEGLTPPPPWPVDRAIAVFGPKELDSDLLSALQEAVGGLDATNDVLVTGLRRGAELVAAELAVAGKIPVAVVLPYANPAQAWPPAQRERFDHCMASAAWVVDLGIEAPSAAQALTARDRWIERCVIGALVVDLPEVVDRLEGLGLGVVPVEAE